MSTHRFLFSIIIAGSLLVTSCSNQHNRSTDSSTADSNAATISAGSTATTANSTDSATSLSDPARKLIKTGDIRCRVKDVYAATTRLEAWTTANGGEISASHLSNETNEFRTLAYKPDSLRQVQSFTTTARLTLRIPVARLDSLLAQAAGIAAFIDTRNQQQEDVTLRYLANHIKNEAAAQQDNSDARRLARRTADAIQANEEATDHSDTRTDRMIENKSLTNDAAYATLDVTLYQPLRMDEVIIPNTALLLMPSFGQRLLSAWQDGCSLLSGFLLLLVHIWPLSVITFIVLFIYRRKFRGSVLRLPPVKQS